MPTCCRTVKGELLIADYFEGQKDSGKLGFRYKIIFSACISSTMM